MIGKRALARNLALVLVLLQVVSLGLAQEPAPQGDAVPQASVGTAFTYQGRLNDGGSLADGAYDFRFRLYDADSGGTLLGDVAVGDVVVSDGFFTVKIDFGSGVFSGEARYLRIGVRPGDSSGAYTDLTPRQELTPAPHALALPGLWTRQNATSPNLIGGYHGNAVAAGVVGATIGGGGDSSLPNRVTDIYGTVGGGGDNLAGNDAGPADDAPYSTVGGGLGNVASGFRATIGGGALNTASSYDTTVGGGYSNTASHYEATVGGGYKNEASGNSSTVGGGQGNSASGGFATIAGGGTSDPLDLATANRATDDYATVAGGGDNQAGNGDVDTTNAIYASVGGGWSNLASDTYATIAGGYDNVASNIYATVGGGEWNEATGIFATVAGGQHNVASGGVATVAGGTNNVASGNSAIVAGGHMNVATDYASVGGGRYNQATGQYATIAGGGGGSSGAGNRVSHDYGTVGGGRGNSVSGADATVCGGASNTASAGDAAVGGGEGNTASGACAAVGGGCGNVANNVSATVGGGEVNYASGQAATTGGGSSNSAFGLYATVPGGRSNYAGGSYSFAAGRRAKAYHQGAFVWADSTNANFDSTTSNQFRVRAYGGVQFHTSAASVYAENSGGARWSAAVRANNTNTSIGMAAYMTNDSSYATAHFANGGDGQVLYLENGGSDTAGSGGGDFITAVNDPESDAQFRVTTSGQARSDVGFTTPAADLAEMFPAVGGLTPGDVLVIGPDGKLARSTVPYQPSVVGVYSTQPGFVGGQPVDRELAGYVPLAVVGIVPVKASAENGAIRPGDLLAASSTPGHAMRCEGVEMCFGHTLGKALEGLAEGTVVIKMLVILQ